MEGRILTLVFFLPQIIAMGQDTTYFDYDRYKVSTLELATYYTIVIHDKTDTNRAIETMFYKSGQIKKYMSYSVYKDKKPDGKFKEWHENGQLRSEIDYKDGKLSDKLLTYWENGKPKRIDSYENDKLMEGKCLNSEGMEIIYFEFEKKPEFPGGDMALMDYLRKEIKYPDKAKRKGIQGRVVVDYFVMKDGTISKIKIIDSVNDELDAEAVRIIKNMPLWEPGMHDGEAVDVKFTFPFKFQLN